MPLRKSTTLRTILHYSFQQVLTSSVRKKSPLGFPIDPLGGFQQVNHLIVWWGGFAQT